jgi:raffinose/stachyose/melibiose transport system substrate-binding protein
MDSSADYGDELQGGSFDWTQFDQVTNFMLELRDKGYYNVDYVTADKNATHTEMAADKAVFTFQSNQSITEIQKLNPESKVNMMRLPVRSESDDPFLISGERDAIGIWKDTAHEKEALKFLEFMAQPEHVAAVAASYSIPAAFDGVEVELGPLNEVFMQYEGAAITNHFDRKYLPNGMWNTLKSVGTGMLSDMSASEVSEMMKQNYERLRAAAAQ